MEGLIFGEIFFLADINIEMVLKIFFLTLFNVDIRFAEKKFKWKSYTIAEALHITKKVELINKKEFVTIAMDKTFKTFVIDIATL